MEKENVTYQSITDPNIVDHGKKFSSVSPKNKENMKTKKTQQNFEKDRRRYANAFQQRQQKQFTYSVSYFNWAVSDEEEEEDEEISQEVPSPSSALCHNRSSTCDFEKIYLNGSRNDILYQQRKNITKMRKWGQELPIEDEVSELAVISPSAKGIVLTEEFIEVTLPFKFKRLGIAKNNKYEK